MDNWARIFKRIISVGLCLSFIIGFVSPVKAHLLHKRIRVAIPIQQECSRSDRKSKYEKYTYDYLNKISQYTNWQYEFVGLVGNITELTDEMLRMLENGEIDIIAPIEMSDDTLEHCDLTGYHYGMTYLTISVLTENMTVTETDYRTLNGLNIAVLKSDTKRIAELKKFFSSNDITYELVECESEEALQTALKSGRADAALGVNTSPMANTRVVAKFASAPYYFAVRKGNIEILNGLNMAMNKIDQVDPYFSSRLNKKYFIDAANTMILTQAEKEYITQNPVLTVLVPKGTAPIQYADKNGEIRGISRKVLDKIAEMTGLVFEYKSVISPTEVLEYKDADLLCGIPYNYASHSLPDMLLSQPFLKSSTILFMQSSLNIRELDDKRYAAVRGSALPEGIKEENAIYFNTREESLEAVNSGRADYGYGNAYSVAFYILQNGYKNIVTIPQEKESREYCMGFINQDKLLISIINKSLSAIDNHEMRNIILDVTTDVDREITPSMVFDAYSKEIIIIVFIVMALLLLGIISKVQANIRLKMQNKRHEVLSELSNEYLYEYNIKDGILILSERCIELFETQEAIDNASEILKDSLSTFKFENNFVKPHCKPWSENDNAIYEIKLPLANDQEGIFKVISTSICDGSGKVESIIGKLIDISEEIAEKEALVIKAQTDGLTSLYNPTTTKELITERLKYKDEAAMDAFVLLDLDFFKEINDNLGHYMGDKVLKDLAKILKEGFRKTDIIGRLGGDEFCIYMKDIPSVEFVQMKCRQLIDFAHRTIEGITISVSIGIALLNEAQPYEELFQMADDALYQAKRNGRGQFVIYNKAVGGIIRK